MNGLDYTLIGSRIRKARTALKLTQEEASERCDITNSFYGNIERGDKKMSVETLVKISRGLGVSLDQLVYGEFPEEGRQLETLLQDIRRKADDQQYEKFFLLIKTLSEIIDQL